MAARRREPSRPDTLLRDAVARSGEPLALTDADGGIIWLNEAGAALLGTGPEELAGQILDTLCDATPLLSGDGLQLRRIQSIGTAEAEEYRSIRALSSDILYRIDLAGQVVSISHGIERLGYTPAELRGRGIDTLVAPESMSAMQSALAEKMDGSDARSRYEIEVLARDGTRHWLDIESWLVFEEDEPRFVQGIARDISERKAYEKGLAASEDRLRRVLDTIPSAVWAYDGEDIVFVNLALATLSGHPRERLMERGFFASLIHPDDGPAMVGRGRARLRGEPVPRDYEVRIIRADGATRWLLISAEVAPFEGKDVSFVAALDITDQKREQEAREALDAQLQQTQKLESLGILAGGIAHDFNNLLTGILGNAALAMLDLPRESPATQSIEAIELAARRAADLTREMLAYAGRASFVTEPLNLSRVMEEMSHLLEVVITKRAILKKRFAPDLPPVEADAAQIRQVMMNLITNASDAIGERSGVISISTSLVHADRSYLESAYLRDELPEADYVLVEVTDTGVGMDAETQARIFDPFYTTKFSGRGLGLAAVIGIVRAHHGAIKVYSEPGQGTTFKVLLPAAPHADPATDNAMTMGEQPDALRGRILVADDDRVVRGVVRDTLERMGLDTVMVEDGEQVLSAVDAGEVFDVILLDLTMPVLGGDDAFRELRARGVTTPVVLMSGYSELDMRERFSGRDVAAYIQKPFAWQGLYEVLRRILVLK